MNKISEHISYLEAVKSSTGYKNEPNAEQLAAMKLLAEKVFEPLRKHFNIPIIITSFFRSLAVNAAVGGVSTSQHLKGEAIDIKATGNVTNADMFNWLKDNVEFDQLIWEKGNSIEPAWIHISVKSSENRQQIIYL